MVIKIRYPNVIEFEKDSFQTHDESLSINMENNSARVENSISLIFLW